MREYLITPIEGDWFNLDYSTICDTLCPYKTPSSIVEGWGSNRILVEGEEISFSDEQAGIQVCFESGLMTDPRAEQVVEEIRQNLESKTGQRSRIVRIS